MISDEDVVEYLEHFGVKGMKWGVRRELKKRSNVELKETKAKNKASEKAASKDPTFKREVILTRRKQGISGGPDVRFEKTKEFGRHTGRLTGQFTNSKGEVVSADFANAVLSKAANSKEFRRKTVIGLGALGAMGITVAARFRVKD